MNFPISCRQDSFQNNLLVWCNLFLANFELPNSNVSVQLVFPTDGLNTEDWAELFEEIVGRELARVAAGHGLGPEVDEVFKNQQFRRRAVQNDDRGNVVIVNHRPEEC